MNAEGASDGKQPNTPQIRDFILVRELNEVYLLLDHISGRWDKTFASLETPGNANDPAQVSLKDICEIRWPKHNSAKEEAEMAETLLRAKDKLNAAARPANGATIAFTLLVVGEGDDQAAPQSGERASSSAAEQEAPTRISLARKAFPGLIESAVEFRRRVRNIAWFLCTILVLTCFLSWYAATVNGVLAKMDAIHKQSREIEQKMALMARGAMLNAEAIRPVALAPAPAAGITSAVATIGDYSIRFCKQGFNEVSIAAKPADAIGVCSAFDANSREHDAIKHNLSRLLLWFGSFSETGLAVERNEESGRILTQLLINSILPFLYGVLGAGAAVVRNLWAKTRESLLSPRDYTLALGQLALGAITGACIGLFVNPTAVAGAGDSTLGSLTLTASALSFVAGFGVEGAFLALESLVRRVFNLADPAHARTARRE